MKKIGIYFPEPSSSQIYRGMDAYANFLIPEISSLAEKYNFQICQVTTPGDLTRPDLSLIHFPVFSIYHPDIPPFLKIPYVVTVHDVTRLEFSAHYPSGIRGKLSLIYQKYLLNNAKLIITDSYSSVRQIRRYLNYPNSKIKMVHLSQPAIYQPLKDITFLQDIKTKYELPEKFVLFNGDIDWNKNLTTLLLACHKLNTHLVLYGKTIRKFYDQPESFNLSHPELKHLSKLLPLLKSDLVHLVGFVQEQDLVAIFNLASVYCQPSFAEGFGLPVLQAMACGTPVACSNTHSLPEIAEDAAIYFNPADLDSIISSLQSLLDSPELQKELIQKGFRQSAKFSWSKTADNTLKVYQEALSPL
jgi:glycosyltransferase involved in cell wall biosynthesis